MSLADVEAMAERLSEPTPPPSQARPPRARELGDFSTDRQMLVLAGLAVVVGVLCAFIAVGLMMLIGLITNAVYYHRWSTALVSPAANGLGWWAVPIPIIGGLIIGFMARYGSERIRGHGIPEAMETILVGGSKVEPKLAILKPISSAISIGTGGPFGAEGPIILTGGAFGSLVGQFLHLTAAERKTLLVAGAAAGMAATFNTPIAAVLLAVELLLFEWKPRSLVPVAIASAVATLLRRLIIGASPMFPMGAHLSLPPVALLGSALVGIIGGVLAWLLTLGVYGAEDAFRMLSKFKIHWMWWPAIGGVFVGVGGVFFPRALGVGYDTIGAILGGNLPLSILIGVIVVKTLIWCLALGSGTSGGILAPLLLIGGALGAIEGSIFPGHLITIWALIGMAAALSGVMRSPLTSVVFAFELTSSYDLLLSLLVACVMAHAISVLVLKRSILTEKIARRGLHITREYAVDPLEALLVGEMMQTTVESVAPDLPLNALTHKLEEAPRAWAQRLFPVLNADGKLVGVITRSDLLAAGDNDARPVADIMRRDLAVAYPDETLRMITIRMITQNRWRLPVVSREDPQKLLGIVTQRDLLRARERLLNEERRRERVLHLRWVTSSTHAHNHSRPHLRNEAPDVLADEASNALESEAPNAVPSEAQS